MKLFAAIYLAVFMTLAATQPIGGTLLIVALVPSSLAYMGFVVLKRAFRRTPSPLEETVLTWPTGDKFAIDDMLRSVASFGLTGSGKSSGSGYGLARNLLASNTGGLVLCSKPEDRQWWIDRLTEKNRLHDMILFAKDGEHKCNYMGFESKHGADAGEFTRFLMNTAEVLADQKNRKDEAFWRSLNERILYNAVVPLLAAYGQADAPALRDFIVDAPYHPAQPSDEKWKQGFFNRTMVLAEANPKAEIGRMDFASAKSFWMGEFARMDDKPRSSGLLGVNNCLHTFNQGMVRSLCSTATTFTPEALDEGKWIIVDFPIPEHGLSGKFIMAGIKYLTQRHILRRRFIPGQPIICIYADEAQNVVNSYDSQFILECRSHGGCLLYLTQTIANYQETIGEKSADMLIGQFGHKIFHASDPTTAEYASKLVGSAMQTTGGTSYQESRDTLDRLMGMGQATTSMNEGVRPLKEPREFMVGRTGGLPDRKVDSWVIRGGRLFRDGTSCIRVTWKQKR